MLTAPASGRTSPRRNPHSVTLAANSIPFPMIPLLAVPLRTLRRLRRRRL